MAISVGTTTTGSALVTTGLTFAHDTNGAEMLLVFVANKGSGGPSITGVTFNGDALTQINQTKEAETSGSFWYLLSPDDGSFNVIISASGSGNISGLATNISGMSTTAPIGNSGATNFNSGTTATRNTTCSADSVLFAGFALSNLGNNMTADGTQTPAGEVSATNCAGGTSYKVASVGTNAMTYTTDNAISDGVLITAEIKLPSGIKTVAGLAYASVKTINGLSVGSIKTINGLI